MSFQVTEAFVKQFNGTIYQLSQQRGSRLQDKCRRETQTGKSQFWDRLGAVVAQKKTSRHSDTPLISTPHSRRRLTLNDYEHADLVDNADKIRMLIDPTSDYAQAFMWAFGRAKDDEIIEAHGGTAYAGEEGQTAVTLGNDRKIVSVSGGAGSGLNVEVLRVAKRKLDEKDIDESINRYFAHTAQGLQDMLSQQEVTSSDFNTVRALVQGEVNTFLGFDFCRLQRLKAQSGALAFDVTSGAVGSGAGDADGYVKNMAWAEDGLIMATGQEMKTRIGERADKSYSTQVFAEMTIGATRMEEDKIVEIYSNEA